MPLIHPVQQVPDNRFSSGPGSNPSNHFIGILWFVIFQKTEIPMDQATEDLGTITALMIRFKEYRLPRAMRLLEKVNEGEKLSDDDIDFLKRVYDDSRVNLPLVQRHPEYHDLITNTLTVYTEIINKGLENEKG